MRRWICPSCGSGVNAPERPRADDVRRYCLACSERSGRLVKRAVPALETKRQKTVERKRDRLRRQRERAREARLVTTYDANGVERKLDIEAEVARAMRDYRSRRRPDIKVNRTSPRRGNTTGHAGSGTIYLGIPAQRPSTEDVLVLIYHEAGHEVAWGSAHRGAATGPYRDADGAYHGEVYRRAYAEAVQRRWPFVKTGSLRPRVQRAWDFDRRITEQLEEHTKRGGEL